MRTTRLRGVVAATATLLAALGAAIVPAGGASAESYEHGFTTTVDQVLVNRYGGITVSGQADCSTQVAAIYGAPENIPSGTSVFVNAEWVATQYVGRNKAVTAEYHSGIAHLCYTNDPNMYYGDVTPPWPWATRYGFPVGDIQWVYASNGKFVTGPIHIEMTSSSVELVVGSDTHYFYSFSGWDVRATRVR